MTSQIICNILMFLSYILNIFCMVIALLILPKGLKNLNELCDGLSEKEIFQRGGLFSCKKTEVTAKICCKQTA